MKDQCTITWTGRAVKEAIPLHFELFEYVGMEERAEKIRVYLYRVELVDLDNQTSTIEGKNGS